MTVLLTLTLTILFCLPAMGQQDIAIQWGPTEEIPKKNVLKKLIGTDDEHLYLLLGKQNGFQDQEIMILERYSIDSLKLLERKALPFPSLREEGANYEELLLVGDRLLLFSTFFNRTKARSQVFAQSFDQKGNLQKKAELIDEITSLGPTRKGKFGFALSADSTRFMISHLEPGPSGENEKIQMKVFDRQIDLEWEEKLDLPYKKGDVELMQQILDHEESAYFLARITGKNQAKTGIKYVVIAYDQNTKTVREFEVKPNNKWVSSIAMVLDDSNNLIVTGFYSNKKPLENKWGGTFFLRVDGKTKRIIERSVTDLPEKLLAEFLSDKQIDKGKELQDFAMKYLITEDDGSAILLCERAYFRQNCITEPRTGNLSCTDNYYYEDIMAIRFDPQGKMAWTKAIPKKQHSINYPGINYSFLVTMAGKDVCLLFLDHPKNKAGEEDKFRVLTNPKKSSMTVVRLTPSGEVKRYPFPEAQSREVVIRPPKTLSIGTNSSVLYSEGTKVRKLARLTAQSSSDQ